MDYMNRKKTLLSPEIIIAAVSGDPIAMADVLKHYQNYIASLSLRNRHENESLMEVYVDDFLRRSLESKLIEKILTFDITR